jgi:hypothetical protein
VKVVDIWICALVVNERERRDEKAVFGFELDLQSSNNSRGGHFKK